MTSKPKNDMSSSSRTNHLSPSTDPPPLSIKIKKPAEPKTEKSMLDKDSPESSKKTEHVVLTFRREPKRQKKMIVDDLYYYDPIVVKSPTMELAEQFMATLPPEFPSCLKNMVRSNVTTGFWLHLPMPFCKQHMPKYNTTVVLEDKNGEEYKVGYLVEKTALSAGWKKFCHAQNLMEGDVLVFQLIRPSVLKVYIIRAKESSKADGPIVDVGAKHTDSNNQMENETLECKISKKSEHISEDICPENNQNKSQTVPCAPDSNEKTDEDTDSDATQGNRYRGSTAELEEARLPEDFNICVNGTAIDSELSDYHREKYYELCCSQDSVLHDELLKSISGKFAAEMITETVNIADAIRASNLSTTQADFLVWDKTLEGFELLGMKVGFLRARLSRITDLASELVKLRDIECKQASTKKEIKTIRVKISKLKKTKQQLDEVVEALKVDAERHENLFREAASAPWN